MKITLMTAAVWSLIGPLMFKSYMRNYVGAKVVTVGTVEWSKNKDKSGGTGFHILGPSGKTYILTNRHVCNDSEDGYMWAAVDGVTSDHRVKVIISSDTFDLCLLEGIPGIRGLEIGEAPGLGTDVIYVGHPKLQPRTYVTGEIVGSDIISINAGVIGKEITEAQCKTKDSYVVLLPEIFIIMQEFRKGSLGKDFSTVTSNPIFKSQRKVRVCYQKNKALITTLMIYPGASGSPVVDLWGKLIGVVYAGPPQGGWGYAVILADIKSILNGR